MDTDNETNNAYYALVEDQLAHSSFNSYIKAAEWRERERERERERDTQTDRQRQSIREREREHERERERA